MTDLPEEDERPAHLRPADRVMVRERRRANAAVVHETIREEGLAELRRPKRSLFWSGLAAGLAMGFSLAGEGILRAHLPPEPWRPLVDSLGYATGFIFVVLGRQQLFTENTLTVVLPVLHHRTWKAFGGMLRLWGIVLAANMIGTFLFALGTAHTEIFSEDVRHAFREVGLEAMAGGFWVTFLKAVIAGWLIAYMVWLLPEAGSAAILVITGVTYLVALAELSHIIAGSVEGFYVVVTGAYGFGDFLTSFYLPTLAGNVVGGVTFVAVLNHAQVSDEI